MRKDLAVTGRLYSIEICIKDGPQLHREWEHNLTGAEVQRIRENAFIAGVRVNLDPNKWRVFPPWRISDFTIERQFYYKEILKP